MKKLYIDANVLISVWKDEIARGKLPIYFGYYSERMLEAAIECKYNLVISKLVIGEILEKYKFLKSSLSSLINKLRGINKVEIIDAPDQLIDKAFELNQKLSKKDVQVGWKDCFHLLLAKQSADAFVSWETQLGEIARELGLEFATPDKL